MKIEKISDNTLRISYNEDDLQKININYDTLFTSIENAEKVVQITLEEIQKIQFVYDEDNILFQFFVSPEERIVYIIVTFSADKEIVNAIKHITECNCPNCRSRRNGMVYEKGDYLIDDYDFDDELYDDEGVTYLMYIFKDIEDVIKVAKSFYNMGYTESKLFEYEKRYYFVLEDLMNDDEILKDTEALLKEYGLRSKRTIEFIEEYGNSICGDNAIETLVEYFS